MIYRTHFVIAAILLLGLGACSSENLINENSSTQPSTIAPNQGVTASRAFGGFPVPAPLPVDEGI